VEIKKGHKALGNCMELKILLKEEKND